MNPAPFIVIDDVQISHSGLLCRLVNYLKSKLPNTTVFLVVPNSLMSHADQKFAMIRQVSSSSSSSNCCLYEFSLRKFIARLLIKLGDIKLFLSIKYY